MINYIKLYKRIRFFTLLIVGISVLYIMIVTPSIYDNFIDFETDDTHKKAFYYMLFIILLLILSRSLEKEPYSKIESRCLTAGWIIAICLMVIFTYLVIEALVDADAYLYVIIFGNASIICLGILRIKLLMESLKTF